VRVVRHATARDFLTAAAAFFAATEEQNHLHLAIAESVTRRGGDASAFFATVEDERGVVAVALQTPPFPMQVTSFPEVDALCDALLPNRPSAVISDPITVAAISARLGGGEIGKRLRNHALTAVISKERAAGTLRLATAADLPMLIDWFADYLVDTGLTHERQPAAAAERGVREQSLFLFETEHPVAMATISGRTPHGRRIGDVFTPRALRGRGYGEALTAALSQQILDEGARWCFLFTDANNATSNAVYRRVGYVHTGDWHELVLTR
jgi:uncharacterized protein